MFTVNGTVIRAFDDNPQREMPVSVIQKRSKSFSVVSPEGRPAVVVFPQKSDAFLVARSLEEKYFDTEGEGDVPMLDLQKEHKSLDSHIDIPSILKRNLTNVSIRSYESLEAASAFFSDANLDLLVVTHIRRNTKVGTLSFNGIILHDLMDTERFRAKLLN